MALSFVLDTNIVIYLLAGRTLTPLPSGDHYISVITEIELFASPNLDARAEAAIHAFLQSVNLVDLDGAVRQEAIRLRRSHNLRLPDAVIAASAITTNSELITNDLKLLNVPGLTTRSIPVK
jgi:predicted nucleic acid-binding protein